MNDGKAHYVLARASALADAHPDAAIACLGLSFKANIDDLRESPALEIALELAQKYGARIRVVEPHVDALPAAFDGTKACKVTLEEALDQCAVLVVLVDHHEFRGVSPAQRAGKAIYDTRGLWPA